MTGKTREKFAGIGTRGRNLTVRVAAVLGVLLVLMGVLLILTPRLVNLEPVRNRILDGLSRQIGGTVACERIALSFFPAPAVAFRNLEVASPGNYMGKAKRLTATLKERSLLAGRVEIAALVLEDPDLRVTLPGGDSPGEKEDPFSSLSFLKDGTTIPGKTLPGQITVRSGRFEISGPITVTAAAVTADLTLTFPGSPPPGGGEVPPSPPRISGTVKANIVEGTYGNMPRGKNDGHRPEAFHYGKAVVEDMTVPLAEDSTLHVLSAPVVFDRNGLHLEKAVLELDEKPLVLRGSVGTGEEGVDLDLEIHGDEIRWEELPGLDEKNESVPVKGSALREPAIRGNVTVSLKTLRFGSLAWQPFEADVTIAGRQVSATVRKSRLCGISTPGTLLYGPEGLSLHMKPSAAGQSLEETLSCLFGASRLASGTLSGDGDIRLEGRGKDLLGSLSGTARGKAEKGRIYRMNLLARILAVVNITEILRGKLPDIVTKGFAYDSALVRAVFENGSCLIEEGVIDGASVEIAFTGKIDLPSETMDVTVAVAPLKTADFVVKQIPVIRDILGGNLVAIPVRVTGNLKDPSVIPLEPSAVGAGLLGILKRTLKLPVRLIEPLLPENP